MNFEWDTRKAESNLHKYTVSFGEAVTIFNDELSITISDPDHSIEEDGYITIGLSNRSRLIMVSHTDRNDRIRIISARELTQAERKAYEEKNDRKK
jgi:uncharacterized DUF497 family protein